MATYDNTNLPIKQSHRAYDNPYFGAGGTGPTGSVGPKGVSAVPLSFYTSKSTDTANLTNFTFVNYPFGNVMFGAESFAGKTHVLINFKIFINNSISTYSTTNLNNFFCKGVFTDATKGYNVCESENVDLRLMDDGNRAESYFSVSAMVPIVSLNTTSNYQFGITFLTDNQTQRTASIMYNAIAILQII